MSDKNYNNMVRWVKLNSVAHERNQYFVTSHQIRVIAETAKTITVIGPGGPCYPRNTKQLKAVITLIAALKEWYYTNCNDK